MDEDDEDPVPLPNVNAAILKKVIKAQFDTLVEILTLLITLLYITIGYSMGHAS